MYRLLKPILFRFDPEITHAFALGSLNLAYRLRLLAADNRKQENPVKCFGLTFPNRIGLAAGFDKNGDYVDALAQLGFGFIEIGTLTPKPQHGNPKPRLFRLAKERAVINRMGFNNKGVLYAAQRLSQMKYQGILGINLGKNRDTALEQAVDDYLFGMQQLWKYASYFTINISSPNTPGLRDLQNETYLTNLLTRLKQEQKRIHAEHSKYVPLVIKIAPDLSNEEIAKLAYIFLQTSIDGVIATNTTVERFDIPSAAAKETGGLSGKPLHEKTLHVIRRLQVILQDDVPIIASGGVMDKQMAKACLSAGAKLVQVYTGMVFEGPGLIRKLSLELERFS